jgi:hypothetical protein
MYGNVLYLISLMNIFAVSMGVSCNYARTTESATKTTRNKPYLVVLAVASILMIPITLAIRAWCGIAMTDLECLLLALLMCATMWRYYVDVEYRLKLNYRGYFFYYFAISIGYCLGIWLFYRTGLWQLALLPGELAGLGLVAVSGNILRRDATEDPQQFNEVVRLVVVLLGSETLSTLIFNGDRILLRTVIGGGAVTIYYLASLLGKTASLVTGPLNGVIAGYLARYKGKLSIKVMHLITAAALGCVAAGTLLCVIASHILISRLYPSNYGDVQAYFWIANGAQVLYFITNVITVMLLRFAKARYQLVINVEYAVAFCVVCIPLTYLYQVDGFCVGLLLINAVRFATAIIMGYSSACRGERSKN